jgi:hypothetical protein
MEACLFIQAGSFIVLGLILVVISGIWLAILNGGWIMLTNRQNMFLKFIMLLKNGKKIMKTKTIFTNQQYRLDKVTLQVKDDEVKWYQAYQRRATDSEWAHIGRLATEELARTFVEGARKA